MLMMNINDNTLHEQEARPPILPETMKNYEKKVLS